MSVRLARRARHPVPGRAPAGLRKVSRPGPVGVPAPEAVAHLLLSAQSS